MSFSDLKRNSANNFNKLNAELTKLASNKQSSTDETEYWKPTTDKMGNGFAVIRFLPAPDGEDLPFVRVWDHGFQGPGGWYIEKSLTTFNEKDPLGEYNSQLWNSGIDADKETARKQKRRLSYHSNIYVVKDPGNPENEGKVFKYKYGKKIFDKLNDMMNPSFEDEQPINPFDMWSGANFRLKIRKVEGYPNYDKSEFDTPGPLLDDDDKLEEIWKSQYSLQAILDRKNFKTYDELKARLDKVLGLATAGTNSRYKKPEDEVKEEDIPWGKEAKAATPKESTPASELEEDEDDLDFFKKIMDED